MKHEIGKREEPGIAPEIVKLLTMFAVGLTVAVLVILLVLHTFFGHHF